MVIGVAAAEIALALLVAWTVVRTRFGVQASPLHTPAARLWLVAPVLGCLGLFVFALARTAWRLSAGARAGLLVVLFLSLTWCFCALCWYDVSAAKGRPAEQTAAAALALAALAFGLVALTVISVRDRRHRDRPAREGAA